MAISKLKPRHASEGRSIAAALKDRLDYDKNPEKTDGGLLVTGYQCSPDTAWQEFAVSKQIYTATTGRKRAPDQDVISYLIIQSFEPGTITPEDANKLGYKLAMEFTGGEHQFIVAIQPVALIRQRWELRKQFFLFCPCIFSNLYKLFDR